LEAVIRARPDVAWLEWPLLLLGETLAQARSRLPGTMWVSFQDDNPFVSRPGEQQRWRLFLEAIPEYDLHFVKRQSDVLQFQQHKAKAIQIFKHGFFRTLFRPISRADIAAGQRHEVSFVGTPLDHRTSIISDLLVQHDIPLQVYGGRWNRTMIYHRRRKCFCSPVLGEEYVRVICGSRISLGFVSSSNRDEYTMRTFEIPACKGFFLAERTPAHQELFAEGKEAEFFASSEECAVKIKFYLKSESERNRIAESGYQRCLKSDYSLQSSLARAVAQIKSLQE
jgi:spore maturation protein CgeB